MEGRLGWRFRFELLQPPMDVGTLERGAGAAWALLIVSAGSAVSPLAAKDLFDEPAVGQHLKPAGLDALDNIEPHPALLLNLVPEAFTAKAAVGVNHLHLAPPRFVFDLKKQRQSTDALIQAGR